MSDLLLSARLYLGALLRKWMVWVPIIFLDPFDLYDRYLRRLVPERLQVELQVPTEWIGLTFVVMFMGASFWTFHDLRRRLAAEMTSALEQSRDVTAERQADLRQQLVTAQAQAERLRVELAEYTDLQPIKAVGLDYDQNFIRLVVANPNRRAVAGCSVQLVDMVTVGSIIENFTQPGRGHRFPRGSHAGGSQVAFDMGPNGRSFVDIAFYLPDDRHPNWLTHWFVPSVSHSNPDSPITTQYSIPIGIYDLQLELGSEGTHLPSSTAVVRVTFEGADRLRAELLETATGS